MNDIAVLFQLSRNHLLAFATSILRNDEEAQDVVQEVFMECLDLGQKVINKSYLFKAVRNRSLNRLRYYKKFSHAMERLADYLQLIENSEDRDDITIMDYVKKLPLKQKEVLVLRIKAELKVSEIANVLEIPEGTVKSRLNKALKSLRENVKGI